jgi:Endonuclease/Exonuclease/phosphatase family
MPKALSVASWNVEHFGTSNDTDINRVNRVADFILGNNGGPSSVPDVFALYEVEGKDVFETFMSKFPDHSFHLTEGKQTQEIFIGVHKNLQSFSTQRLEFKTGREYQRPGLLLTLNVNNVYYSLLFLHVKSGKGTEDFGLRDAAIEHAFNLKKALDEAAGGQSNFIFMGDLNTMGIDDPVPYSKVLDLTPEDEVERIAHYAQKRKMKLIPKDKTLIEGEEKEVTWFNGSSDYKPSNLDHVVASEHLNVRANSGGNTKVTVLGWPKLSRDKWEAWFTQYSDHAMLYFEVW